MTEEQKQLLENWEKDFCDIYGNLNCSFDDIKELLEAASADQREKDVEVLNNMVCTTCDRQSCEAKAEILKEAQQKILNDSQI